MMVTKNRLVDAVKGLIKEGEELKDFDKQY